MMKLLIIVVLLVISF
ncbi:type I toxin-antitoxin system Ibs family toxin, partial [Escherichia coli]